MKFQFILIMTDVIETKEIIDQSLEIFIIISSITIFEMRVVQIHKERINIY